RDDEVDGGRDGQGRDRDEPDSAQRHREPDHRGRAELAASLDRVPSLHAVAEFLRAGGTPQIQLTDRFRQLTDSDGDATVDLATVEAVRDALRTLADHHHITMLSATGEVIGEPSAVPPQQRFVVEWDGRIRGPLPVQHH
ncbi:hypothetical protein, partial [Escherichia coli]